MLTPLVFLMAVRPVQTQSVSLELSGVTVETLVRKVNEATGLHDSVEGKVGQEVVAVLVKDMPVEQLKGLVAKVVYGKWVGDRLVSDEERIKAEQKAEDAAYLVQVRKDRKLIKTLLNSTYDNENGRITARTFTLRKAQEPDQREIFQIAANLPDQFWVRLKKEGRVVLSTHPTSAQMKLDYPGLREIVMRHIGISVKDPHEEDRKTFPEIYAIQDEMTHELASLGMRTEPVEPLSYFPAKVLFTMVSKDHQSTNQADTMLIMFDGRGHVVYEKGANYYRTLEFIPEKVKSREEEQLTKLNGSDFKIAFTMGKDGLWHRTSDRTGSYERLKVPVSTLLELSADRDWNFASVRIGELAVAYAKSHEKNLICELEDRDCIDYKWCSLDQVRNKLWPNAIPPEEDGVLIRAEPLNSATGRKHIDFSKILSLVNQLNQGSSVGLDSTAKQTFDLSNADPDSQFVEFIENKWLEAGKETLERSDELGVLLWGALTDSQRSRLRGGGRILVSSLPNEFQKRLWDKLRVGPYIDWYLPENRTYEPWVYKSSPRCGVGDMTRWIFDSFEEPTEVFPGGMPRDAFLEFSSRDLTYFGIIPKGEDQVARIYSTDEVSELLDAKYSLVFEGRAQAIKVRRSMLKLFLAPNLGREFEFVEKMGNVGEPFPLDKVPAAFQKELDDSHQRMVSSRMYQLGKELNRAIQESDKRAGGGG